MRITIIGWYGTETIGDRAILVGLISLLSKSFENFEIRLGSLHPFFTDRTLSEDFPFINEITKKNIKIKIFNSTKKSELKTNINGSDVLIMGGGPLMDLYELYMVEYAFKIAKKIGVRTVLGGCGVGPLFKKKFRKTVLNIVQNSDLVILRDESSKENLKRIFNDFRIRLSDTKILTSFDPAVECALEFKKLPKETSIDDNLIAKNSDSKSIDYIAINLRAFPEEYTKKNIANTVNYKLTNFVKNIAAKYNEFEIKLIPMHYFHVGGDDRIFLNEVAIRSDMPNIYVQNENLTLKETMHVYQDASFNIGMRFHSVVLQTIISGNNFVLDYTQPKIGKISGFLRSVDSVKFYDQRYISLQSENFDFEIIKNTSNCFNFDEFEVTRNLEMYINEFNYLFRK